MTAAGQCPGRRTPTEPRAGALRRAAATAELLAARYREIAKTLTEDLAASRSAKKRQDAAVEARDPVTWAHGQADRHRREARRLLRRAATEEASARLVLVEPPDPESEPA